MGRGGRQLGQDHGPERAVEAELLHFQEKGQHQDFHGGGHHQEDQAEQDRLAAEPVHRKAVGDKGTEQQGKRCLEEGILQAVQVIGKIMVT